VTVKEELGYFDTVLLRYANSIMKVGIEDRIEVLKNFPDRRILEKFPQLKDSPGLLPDWKALVVILDSDDQLPLVFTTSDYTKHEIQRLPPLVREEVMEIYQLLRNYCASNGRKSRRAHRQRLKRGVKAKVESMLSAPDAIHVLESLRMRCDIFLTCDYKVIHNRDRLQELGVNACSPFGLLSKVFLDTNDEDNFAEMKRFWNDGLGLLLR
jgi:hypothetical protein